jgi:aminoglycoside phosphotransferase (APT) family kinase protein
MDIDVALVRRLIGTQFPEWAHLPVRPVPRSGWDNRSFRLGEELLVRLPSAAGYAEAVAKEQRWLPVLGPQLPLPVPVPVAAGAPDAAYPWPWSVYRWLEGSDAVSSPVSDLPGLATDLAAFLVALQQVDPTGGPAPGQHCWWRGAPLTHYDVETRRAIDLLGDAIDGRAATAVWERALAGEWQLPPRWFHGDVAVGNLLVREDRLAAVIDFGTSGVGDPACDLVIAWTLFDGASRTAFEAGLDLDDGTWARGRGWALWKALIVRAGTAEGDATDAARVIAAALADA